MKKILWGCMAAASLTLAGCDVEDPIYNTPHPETGQITLTTDWSNIGAGLTPPASYTIKVGDYSTTLSGNTNTIPNLFLPGNYHANVYNTADKITISGTTATVATATAPAGETGTFIDPMPGWLFTWAGDQTIEKDKDYTVTAAMQQQVRQLSLVIEPTGGTVSRIASITAILSGVASQLNIDNGTAGTAASVVPEFEIQSDGKYKATVHLLGITGSSQKLNITVTFNDNTPPQQFEQYDLASLLAGFNTDKKTPLTLGTQVVETPAGAGITATITDWIKVTGSGTAN